MAAYHAPAVASSAHSYRSGRLKFPMHPLSSKRSPLWSPPMSSSGYSDSSEDDNATELTLEADAAINKTLLQAVTGAALADPNVSITTELEGLRTKQASEVQQENEEALEKISAADPKDPTDAFLKDFFAKRRWEGQGEVKIDDDSDDLESIDEALEFEEMANQNVASYRHLEAGGTEIASNPRRVAGEQREKETARHRKRREESEQARIKEEEIQRRLDEVDEKFKAIAEANGGKLTKEQLSEYTDAVAAVMVDGEEPFQYNEVEAEGGMEKAIRIWEGADEEEDEGERRRHHHRGRGRGFGRGGPRRGGRGRGDARMRSYFGHRH